MSPLDLSNALLYGIPIVMYVDLHRDFGALLARRGQVGSDKPKARPTQVHTSNEVGPALRCSIAQSAQELGQARTLVRDRYAWRGYDVGQLQDSPKSGPEPGRREVTFVVSASEVPLGTVTLGLDGDEGLLAEGTDEGVINKARQAGRRVCELTRLAIVDNADSKAVLASLFSLAHAVGRSIYGVTDVFIEVNPRHVSFYSRLMGFVVAAGEKFCDRVRAPSVLLRLEVDELEERLDMLGMCDVFKAA
jgi:N-acyl amino acid synthase FeeM